ncbi:Hypp2656 [Branchiostoma lanceolatum]|uniref:Hypp2656 protein n=1 Tax=Branchiostoma lanceolatum TaxID=7740 RepID=A0A8J9ZW80_BRALA|nr:Hypp2656 [Branchiostoma lanceolatum]
MPKQAGGKKKDRLRFNPSHLGEYADQAKPRCAPTACVFCAPGRKIEKSETTPYGFDMDSKDKELTVADATTATTQPQCAHVPPCTSNCVSPSPNVSKKGKKKKRARKGPYDFDIEDLEDEDLTTPDAAGCHRCLATTVSPGQGRGGNHDSSDSRHCLPFE